MLLKNLRVLSSLKWPLWCGRYKPFGMQLFCVSRNHSFHFSTWIIYFYNHFLGSDPRIQDKRMKELISDMLITVNLLILDIRHVFLVEDILDTMKFGLFLWLLAYMGSLINAITIIIIVWTGLFTIPKVKSRWCLEYTLYFFYQNVHPLPTVDQIAQITRIALKSYIWQRKIEEFADLLLLVISMIIYCC